MFLAGTDVVLVIFGPPALDPGPGVSRCSMDEGLAEPCDPLPHLCVIHLHTVLAVTHLGDTPLLPLRGLHCGHQTAAGSHIV